MAENVALVDYGAGNLHSVENALRRAGADVTIATNAAQITSANRIVLPGVGSFRACMEGLRASGMVGVLEESVLERGVPFLGICVGMQLLAARGLEHGDTAGLGWIAGEVRRMEPKDADVSDMAAVKVPHMGWNDVILPGGDQSHMPQKPAHPVLETGEAYFLHSYHFAAQDKQDVLAQTDHGGPLVAAVGRGNILGVQFHPEKSQSYGLKMLERFLKWKP